MCKLLASHRPASKLPARRSTANSWSAGPSSPGNAYVAPASDPPGMAGPEVQDSAEVAKGRSVLFF